MGIIVAIGGYQKESKKARFIDTPIEIDKEIIRLTGKKKPNLLFLPTASSDSSSYIDMIKALYQEKLGANFDTLLLWEKEPSKKEIQEKLTWADIIYVGGGNTLKMMKKWRRIGIDKLLKKAHKENKVLCGVSAGSICWFEYGVSDSLQFYGEKESKYIRVKGLGILPGVHCPHYGSKLYDKGHRTKGMKAIMKRTKGKCLAIPDACAVLFDGSKIKVLSELKASLGYWDKNKWIMEKLKL